MHTQHSTLQLKATGLCMCCIYSPAQFHSGRELGCLGQRGGERRSLDFSRKTEGTSQKPERDNGCTTVTFRGSFTPQLLTVSLTHTTMLGNGVQGALSSTFRLSCPQVNKGE